jgi:hypothetical protein
MSDRVHPPEAHALIRRHLRFGWIALLAFLLLGVLLEAMHGLKIGWYLNTGQETRRLLLTLAHAHGVLLALVNLAFASTLTHLPSLAARGLRIASPCLLGAGILLPVGFGLGGLATYGGDPGLGIFLVPPAALLLAAGVGVTAWAVWRAH